MLPAIAGAATWTDPSLRAALAEADLVVRARAPERGSQGKPMVQFAVERVLKGNTTTPSIRVAGLHDSARSDGATFGPGEVVYLILNKRKGGGYRVPTPTFGRFPVRDDTVRFVALRDTYLRLDFSVGDFERLVLLHLGRPNEGWLASLRNHLAKGSPADEGPARTQHYLALEALVLAGGTKDVRLILPFFEAEQYQLRVSACRAMAAAAGRRGAGRLLAIARDDSESAVRTTAILALGGMKPPPEGLVEKLVGLLPKASEKDVRFSGVRDPRLNKWPAPKVALLKVMTRHGAGPAKQALLQMLDEPEIDLYIFDATLTTLISLRKDPRLPAELIDRFRSRQELNFIDCNKLLAHALSRLTGRNLGDDPARWQTWLSEQEKK